MSTELPVAAFGPTVLSPLRFLERSERVFADRCAVVDGNLSLTYRELAERSGRLVGALAGLGVGSGDRVAALCANSHVMLELHHGVPGCGAVLVSLNTRLSLDELAYVLDHSGATVLVATREHEAAARALAERSAVRLVVEGKDYEGLLAAAERTPFASVEEQQPHALNYTSGTTGDPKGALYHHRGAYLQALAMAYHVQLRPGSRYLWTLPMFHCNGWCFPWAVTAAGGTHVCLRSIDPARIWHLLRAERVTHFSAAPTVLTMIAEADGAAPLADPVAVTTGGAPPSPTLLARLAGLGMDVTHLYGLTETFGPVAVNEWQPEWSELALEEQSRLRARQGVANIVANGLRVVDEAGREVPADGLTVGEIVVRGNDVMLGYYRDPEATAAASVDGWFRTGDLGVLHADGYVELTDRSKDIIISGGENISSVEVERVLDEHPTVLESAVVAVPDERWGEVPVAFVAARAGSAVDPAELREHVRARLAHFKVPKRFLEAELPKTSTGKIRKNLLRDLARETSTVTDDETGGR